MCQTIGDKWGYPKPASDFFMQFERWKWWPVLATGTPPRKICESRKFETWCQLSVETCEKLWYMINMATISAAQPQFFFWSGHLGRGWRFRKSLTSGKPCAWPRTVHPEPTRSASQGLHLGRPMGPQILVCLVLAGFIYIYIYIWLIYNIINIYIYIITYYI